jgi:MFS family permease
VLELLRRRSFALLWSGGLVSVAGDWMLKAALPFFVYEETGSTVATAGMVVATLLPGVLAGSVVGVFVDRWDRRRVLVVANLLHAVIGLLLLAGALPVVYLVAALQSLVASFAQPAENALLPSLVETEKLVAANALNALNNRIGRLVGAPVGGALLAATGIEAVVLADCATFLAAALLIAPIAAPARTPRPARDAVSAWTAFWREWVAGLQLVRRDRTISLLFVVFGLMTFAGTMLDPLTVAWVRDVLDAGPDVFASLIAVHAATGIAGTLLVGHLGVRLTPRQLIGWTSVVAGAATAVKYNVPVVAVAFATTAVQGITSVASSVGAETLAMRTVGEEFRGRIFGSLNATLMLLSLLGATAAGTLAEAVGLVPVLNVAAALIALSGLIVLRAFRN